MVNTRFVEGLWYGNRLIARLGRLVLLPFSMVFRAVVAGRNACYHVGVLRVRPATLPTISIGNLTVGGTGKTPLAAWMARELVMRGARPAIVLRGYGADEPTVHRTLNPSVPVVVSPDRAAGIATASAQGCDIAVLDDAFQHRRVGRDADVVLVSADRWAKSRFVLPAGPWREPLSAARRASLIVVTRKAASDTAVHQVVRELERRLGTIPIVVARLGLGELHPVHDGAAQPIRALSGTAVLAIAAIGDPESFFSQLAHVGARVQSRRFPDHHHFSDAEIADLASAAEGADFAVCTLKDAVKLANTWRADAPPLWYVLQAIEIEQGQNWLEHLFERILSRVHAEGAVTSAVHSTQDNRTGS